MNYKVSIIVPVYNTSKYLEECVNSILKQTYKNLEIILIDDFSKDDSFSIIKRLAMMDNRIKYKKNPRNMGPSFSRNEGIKMSTSKLITFVDSDDLISKDYIYNMVNNYEKDILVRTNEKKNSIYEYKKYMKIVAYGKTLGTSCQYLIEKSKIDSLFDEKSSYMEDTLFIENLISNYKCVKTIKNNSYYYRKNDNSLTRSSNYLKKISGYIYSIDKIESILKEKKVKYSRRKITNRKVFLVLSCIHSINNIDELKELFSSNTIKTLINNSDFFNRIRLNYKFLKIRLYIKGIFKHENRNIDN